jgi:hypothetical protein
MRSLAFLSACASALRFPFQDPTLTVDERVADLLPRMSLEEKVAQMLNPVGSVDGPGNFAVNATNVLQHYSATGLGTLYTGIRCDHIEDHYACQTWLQSSMINASRFGIPVSFIGETLVAGTGGGTIFPQPVLRGASFNVELEARIGVSIARQARLGGIDRGLSPVLQVDTDVRFGRFEESYGEDPFLVSTMGVAVASECFSAPSRYPPPHTHTRALPHAPPPPLPPLPPPPPPTRSRAAGRQRRPAHVRPPRLHQLRSKARPRLRGGGARLVWCGPQQPHAFRFVRAAVARRHPKGGPPRPDGGAQRGERLAPPRESLHPHKRVAQLVWRCKRVPDANRE